MKLRMAYLLGEWDGQGIVQDACSGNYGGETNVI